MTTNKNTYPLSYNDTLSAHGISKYLNESCRGLDLKIYKSISSTNTVLKEFAANGAPEGTVLVAESQTAGKGRLGRSFHSPSDTGIYFSILLRPSMSASESLFLTTAAAVAVARGIESVSDCKADIKWVNDVYINDKKVCGILTEGSLNIETGGLDYAIVGIGINIYSPRDGFPESLENIAGSVFSNGNVSYNTNENISYGINDNVSHGTNGNIYHDTKARLTAEILNNFMDYYYRFPDRSFFEEYKARSFLLGREIYVVEGEKLTPATALDLTDDCHLVVRFEDGKTRELSSGEVSIKIKSN